MSHVLINNEAALAAPSEAQLLDWATTALAHQHRTEAEVSISLVDAGMMQELNKTYRDQDKPTNVLSFYTDIPAELGMDILGDIIICPEVVYQEAETYGVDATMRWAHMVTHGILHLLGYDHIEPEQQAEMEHIETQILQTWGYTCPYSIYD